MGSPRWPKATWALVLWTGLILLWMIAGGAGKDVLRRRGSRRRRLCAWNRDWACPDWTSGLTRIRFAPSGCEVRRAGELRAPTSWVLLPVGADDWSIDAAMRCESTNHRLGFFGLRLSLTNKKDEPAEPQLRRAMREDRCS